jgi:hypothetical protein
MCRTLTDAVHSRVTKRLVGSRAEEGYNLGF